MKFNRPDGQRYPRMQHKYSNSDDALLPHTPPDTSTWGQLAANIMTKQSVADVTGRRENWHHT
jgi:hypothetical protein